MCQSCVDQGLMTAEDLAARLARGDKDVVAMVDLDFPDFLEAISECLALEMEGGLPLDVAIEAGKVAVDIWLAAQAQQARELAALEKL